MDTINNHLEAKTSGNYKKKETQGLRIENEMKNDTDCSPGNISGYFKMKIRLVTMRSKIGGN